MYQKCATVIKKRAPPIHPHALGGHPLGSLFNPTRTLKLKLLGKNPKQQYTCLFGKANVKNTKSNRDTVRLPPTIPSSRDLAAAWHLLFATWHFFVCHLAVFVCHLAIFVCHLLLSFCHLTFFVCHLAVFVCHLTAFVCHLPFFVCHLEALSAT